MSEAKNNLELSNVSEKNDELETSKISKDDMKEVVGGIVFKEFPTGTLRNESVATLQFS